MPASRRFPVLLMPLVSLALLLAVLRKLSSLDVRDNPIYLLFYLVMGAVWLGLAMRLLPFCDLSVRDDALERGNQAATYAVCGALIAITLCFAGGNIGSGPGWWVVVESAGLATLGLFTVWIALQASTQISDSVSIGRDDACGIRLAGLLIAVGIVFGRVVAGDWHGEGEMVVDFVRYGWPVIILAGLAALAELRLRPSVQQPLRPIVTFGLLPALIYVGLALVVLAVEPLSQVIAS